MTTTKITMTALRSDPELQPRASQYVEAKAEEYALALEAGDTLPPIVVVERNGGYVVVVGHNRAEAHKRAGRSTIDAEVIPDTGNERLFWEVAVPSNSTHGAGYDDTDKQAIFDRFISEGRHKLPDGQIRSSRKIAEALPFRVSHMTVDKWLKARGVGATDKRGGARGFVNRLQNSSPSPSQPTKTQAELAQKQRIAKIKAAGATKLPSGGWRIEAPEDVHPETVSPNATKPTLTLPSPRGSSTSPRPTAPLNAQPMENNMSEITSAIARVEKHFRLVPSREDQSVALAAIKALTTRVSALFQEADDEDDKPSIPSYMKARLA